MAKDLGDAIGTALGKVAREAVGSVSTGGGRGKSNGPLSGAKGVAAGVGVAALAPVAARGAGKLMKGLSSNGAGPISKVGEKATGAVKDAVGQSVEKAGGAGGIAKEGLKSAVPGMGGGGSSKKNKSKGVEGVGKGRRMPIQQDIDIGVPLKEVYNQWTQFEEWPKFMHRLESVSQEDESHVSFKTKIWGFSREFKAEIVEQHPDQRIKWKVSEGVTHTGVVTFHELGPRLTRVEVNIDVQPGSLLEKAARGMRHIKRAVRADLARFKAYVLMDDDEADGWRGAIEDGDVKKRRSGQRSSSNRGSSSSRRSSSSQRSSGSSRGRSASSGRSRSAASSRSSGSSSGRSSGSRSSGSRRSTSSRSRASSSNGRSSNGRSSSSGRSSASGRSSSSGRAKSGSRS